MRVHRHDAVDAARFVQLIKDRDAWTFETEVQFATHHLPQREFMRLPRIPAAGEKARSIDIEGDNVSR